jgi:hypothetical protein
MTVRPASADIPLPHLVTKCRRALEQEARDLKGALDEWAEGQPVKNGPFGADVAAMEHAASQVRVAQQQLLALAHYHARMIFVNGHDHLSSMARLLGSDGAMSLFSHTTLSRSVCEAAVRLSWLMDPEISYEERITRSAAVTYYGAKSKLKGAKQGLTRVPDEVRQTIVDRCEGDFNQISELIGQAGMDFGRDRNGKIFRIELNDSEVKALLDPKTGPLMEELLADSPGWYSLSSAVAHSTPWVLDSSIVGDRGAPELSLTPDQLEIAASALAAIAGSALILERHATYFGFDPEPYLRKNRRRRGMLDILMREYAVSRASAPVPLIRAEP